MEALLSLQDFASRRAARLCVAEEELHKISDLLSCREAHHLCDSASSTLDHELHLRLAQLSEEVAALHNEQSRLRRKIAHLQEMVAAADQLSSLALVGTRVPQESRTAKPLHARMSFDDNHRPVIVQMGTEEQGFSEGGGGGRGEGEGNGADTSVDSASKREAATTPQAAFLNRKALEDHLTFGLNSEYASDRGIHEERHGPSEGRRGSTVNNDAASARLGARAEAGRKNPFEDAYKTQLRQRQQLPQQAHQHLPQVGAVVSHKCLGSSLDAGFSPAPAQHEFRHRNTKALEDHFSNRSMLVD